jgi:hypothetical protein
MDASRHSACPANFPEVLADTVQPLLRDGLVATVVGNDVLVLDADATQVMCISGTHATSNDLTAFLHHHGMQVVGNT